MDLKTLFEIESLTGLQVLKHDRAILKNREDEGIEFATIVYLENHMVLIKASSTISSTCFYVFRVKDILKAKQEKTTKEGFNCLRVKYDKEWNVFIPTPFYEELKKAEDKAK